MRFVLRIIVCTGVSLLVAACVHPPQGKAPTIVEPRGAVTTVAKSKPELASIEAGKANADPGTQRFVRSIAALAKAIETGDTSSLTTNPSGDKFIDAAHRLLRADSLPQIDLAINEMQTAIEQTKSGTARYNLGSILLEEADQQRRLIESRNQKESEIMRLERDVFLLKQKLAETENKLRELATIEEELTRSRTPTPPASQ